MISGSAASLPHSEAVYSSAAFSGSAFTSLGSSSERRYTNRSRRTSGAPPLRSVDATEAPRNEDNIGANSVESSRASRTSSTDDSGPRSSSSLARQEEHKAQFYDVSRGKGNMRTTLEDQQRDRDVEVDRTATPSITSSTQMSSSSSPEASPPSRADVSDVPWMAPPPSPSITSPEQLLALLSPEQMEAALQLYVDRGGVQEHEVQAVLAALPWCSASAEGRPVHTKSPSVPSHAASKLSASGNAASDDDGGEKKLSALLDPEGWLCVVAMAATSNAPPLTQREAGQQQAAETAVTAPQVKADTQLHPGVGDRYEGSHLEQSSGGVSSSQQLPQSISNGRLGAATGITASNRHGHGLCAPPTPTGRKLAFIDDVDAQEDDVDDEDDESDMAVSQPRASLPELPPRPPSSSLRSLASHPSPSLPSQPSLQPQPKRPAALISSSGSRGRQGSKRPPRSAGPLSSPTYNSISPVMQPIPDKPQLTRSTSPSPSAMPPGAAVVAAAGEAGMRTLFQQCLRTPLATATAMLCEGDWVALVDELRRDGRHKLPPQAILDDVTHTITENLRQGPLAGGLNVSDFAHILHTQLDEVRYDLTATSQPPTTAATAAAASSFDGSAGVEFPTSPDYLFTVPTSAAARPSSGSSGIIASARSSVSFASSVRRASAQGRGWRVLPTWCMSLAGLFPLEMSAVCPVPVVRYLRSVGLMNAVLEALVQRLEVEVEAILDVAPVISMSSNGAGAAAVTASFTRDVRPPAGVRRDVQLRLREVEPTSPAASSSVQGIPSPVGVTDFVWPPRAGSFVSFPITGGGSAGAGRPVSSLAVTSVSHDGMPWEERPVWQPVLLTEEEEVNTSQARHLQLPTTLEGGGVLFAPNESAANISVENAQSHANTSTKRKLSASASRASASRVSGESRYLEGRPLDEISASVVARAKARRLMDELRRSTVPINRYECFARVEHEDEPVQEPLCFVSKAELRKTLEDSTEDDGDASHDSDAMSDLIGTLTYDPAAAEAAEREEAERQRQNAAANGDAGKQLVELGSGWTDQHRGSVRPPQLPRVSASALVPDVFSGPSRASVMLRARPASGARRGSAVPGIPSEVQHRPPPAPPPPPPPPVPGMYRMTGVLLGALPKHEEAALVKRLSQPTCDPRSMGLRAASATAGRSPTPAKPAVATTAVREGRTVLPARAQSAGVRPPTTSAHKQVEARPAPPYNRHPQTHHHDGGDGAGDNAMDVNDAKGSALRRPPKPPRPSPRTQLSASSSTRPSSTPPRLTPEQHRGFYYFDVPPVLVADPLSTVAAATAVAQVMRTPSPTISSSPSPKPTPSKPQPPRSAEAAVRHRRAAKPHPLTQASHPRTPSSKPTRKVHSAGAATTITTAAAAAAAALEAGRSRSAATRTTSARGAARRVIPYSAQQPFLVAQQQLGLHPPHKPARESKKTKRRRKRGGGSGRAAVGASCSEASTPAAADRGSAYAKNTNTPYASEVPLTRRGHGRGIAGDARMFVTRGAVGEAETPVSTYADQQGRSPPPPPVPMSLYERRLLRKLQHAYTMECAGGQ